MRPFWNHCFWRGEIDQSLLNGSIEWYVTELVVHFFGDDNYVVRTTKLTRTSHNVTTKGTWKTHQLNSMHAVCTAEHDENPTSSVSEKIRPINACRPKWRGRVGLGMRSSPRGRTSDWFEKGASPDADILLVVDIYNPYHPYKVYLPTFGLFLW